MIFQQDLGNILIFLAVPVFFYLFQKETNLMFPASLFVMLTACCLGSLSYVIYHAFGVIFHPHGQSTEFYPESMIAQLIFLVFADIILYKPARKYLGWMVTNFHNAFVWRIACIFPCCFTFLVFTYIPHNYYDIYTDWSKVNFTDELKEYIEKIGYYGYEYPGHQTKYYYIAAQELIWKAVRPDIEVTWTTGENMTGNIIDISKEKEEILDLVSKHDLKPSFSETLVKDEVGKTITLTDENNVLNDYDISESEFHKVVKDGNKLIITLNDSLVSEETLKLTRKHYDDAPLLVYSKGNSQKLAALRISTEKETYIKVANEEVPEIVEVPDTGYYDVSGFIGTLLVGVGLVLFKVH